MPPVGFEPTFSAGERPQTYALDRAATGSGSSDSSSSSSIIVMILIIIMSQEFMVLYKSTCRIFCRVGAHYLYVQWLYFLNIIAEQDSYMVLN